MDDYGAALLTIIHDVYGPPTVLNGNMGNVGISEANPPSASAASIVAITPSDSKTHLKLQVQKGMGSQQCSTCQAPGHNSTYIVPYSWCMSTYLLVF